VIEYIEKQFQKYFLLYVLLAPNFRAKQLTQWLCGDVNPLDDMAAAIFQNKVDRKGLSFRHKSILAGDLNVKHPFWNSAVSNPSDEKLIALFDLREFEISAPQYPTNYSPAGNGDVLDIVVHQNIIVSDVIVSDILDSDHLTIIFHILDHVKIKNISEPIEKSTDWDLFQNLSSELISPRIEINSGVEADKAVRGFTASIASAYRLATSKIKLSDVNNDIPALDRLFKHKGRLRKLWQETRDPACKTAVNWVTKLIRRITIKKHLNGGKEK
jgi:hypothetical protein